MQKRLVRKLDLERFLSHVEPHPHPKPDLEQYTIPADVAATMLYVAAYGNDDIINRTVLDLGCGTGRLALGAAFLGAKSVVGVDLEKSAVAIAFESSVKTDLKKKTQWIAGDVDAVRGYFDTVLQNPPYGVQTRKADRRFLEKALETGKRVYSLHKGLRTDKAFLMSVKAGKNGLVQGVASPFLRDFVEEHGGRIEVVYSLVMTVPHMFGFHTKARHEFLVNLYVINGAG